MTTPTIRSDNVTVSGAQFLNLGDPATHHLLIGAPRSYRTPVETNTVRAVQTVVLRAGR